MEIIKDTAAKSIQNKSLDNYYGVIYFNYQTKKFELKSFNINGKITLSNLSTSKTKLVSWTKEEKGNQYIYESDYSTSLRKDKVLIKTKNSDKPVLYIENILKSNKANLEKTSSKVQIKSK